VNARLSAGLPIVVGDLLAGIPLVSFFGAVTAGATIRLAQAATTRLTGVATAELETEQREARAVLRGESI
jgi:hypothetical protein